MSFKKALDRVGDGLYNLVEGTLATLLPQSPPLSHSRKCNLGALTTLRIPHVDLVPINTRMSSGSRLEGYAVYYRGLPIAEMYETRFIVKEEDVRRFSIETRAEIEEQVFARLRATYV